MTTRRQFVIAGALGPLSSPYAAIAQARIPTVGMIGPRPLADAIIQPVVLRSLAEQGYRDGSTMKLEYRVTGGVPRRAAPVAAELIQLKCDLIFAFEEAAIKALRDAASAVPVVFLAVDFDPLEKGMVESLRRPGINMTGVYGPLLGLAAKKVELAQEVLPGAKHFLVFSDLHSRDQVASIRTAAEHRGGRLTIVEFAATPYDLAAGFETGRRAGVEAFLGVSSPLFGAKRRELGELFVKHRLPAFATRLSEGQPGFLTIGPSPNLNKMARMTAQLGARVLQGAKPADTPVQQIDEFELVLNMQTAKALGITFPYSVLSRATRSVG